MAAELLDQGRVQVAPDFVPLLRANGLGSFEAIISLTGGRVARDFPGRRTVRLELKAPGGGTQAIFLKRYEANYLSPIGKLLRRLRWPGSADEAAQEWEALHRVSALGIRTATPIAVGQERATGLVRRSFLMTAEIPDAVEGHTWMARLPAGERREFLRRVAAIARRMHGAPLVHKDFYIGHILVAPVDGKPELFLIDLQRVVQPTFFWRRWMLKDLGAMAYSTLNAGASRTMLMRAFLDYSNVTTLGPAEKAIARAALKRVAWLRTRTPKHG
jgi:heptose I phosphotransferase